MKTLVLSALVLAALASVAASPTPNRLNRTRLAFVPAYTPTPAPTPSLDPSQDADTSNLLANGSLAPDFTVLTGSGAKIRLSHFKGKVVILDFWATWCGPCQESLPHTDSIAKVWQANGVVFLPICSWDDHDSFDTWVKHHKSMAMSFYFDPASGNDDSIASHLYSVQGIPAQFVVGKSGRIVASFDGYDEDGDPKENALTLAIRKACAHR